MYEVTVQHFSCIFFIILSLLVKANETEETKTVSMLKGNIKIKIIYNNISNASISSCYQVQLLKKLYLRNSCKCSFGIVLMRKIIGIELHNFQFTYIVIEEQSIIYTSTILYYECSAGF